MWVLFPDVIMVIISEVAVDVIKHAFITKFNDIPADVRTKPDIPYFEDGIFIVVYYSEYCLSTYWLPGFITFFSLFTRFTANTEPVWHSISSAVGRRM